MGITGLLPFLDKHSKKTNISEFAGKTVAIDTYCWLHKGAFSCADKIIMGQPTDLYIKYCMKFVNMLLSHNIKPILVFDGRHLPAKAETESKRRETRDANRKRAAELIKMGNNAEGKNLLRRSLDVSHKMALEVIKECQAHNVDCIVAPYEADAQLAYLNLSGIADVVITEDSDLTLFGCTKIFFKMDLYGHGVLVEQSKLHLAMGLRLSNFNIDKFRHMCILSGCDYLASLPGIGLGKACKFIVKNTDDNIYNALQRLASSLNMKNLTVTKEYRDSFLRALVTFKHQLVYCPIIRKQVRLNPPTPDVTDEQLIHAGTEIDPELAWQLALGNCDPFTKEKLHNFDPDTFRPKRTNSWSETAVAKHPSIWSRTFKVNNAEEKKAIVSPEKNKLPAKIASTKGQVAVMKVDSLKKELTPRKRTFEEAEMNIESIVQIYKRTDSKVKAQLPVESKKVEELPKQEPPTSPVFVRRSNPFKKLIDTSPSLLNKRTRRLPVKSRLTPTVIDDTAIAQSEFFAAKKPAAEEPMDVAESMDVNVDEEDCKENIKFCSSTALSARRVIIPETEIFDDEEISQDDAKVEKDSGYRELSDDKDPNSSAMSCDVSSVDEKSPLRVVQNNLDPINENPIADFDERLKVEEVEKLGSPVEEEIEFSITREIFSEYKSSMFMYESPVPEKRLKKESYSSSNLRKSTQLSQGSSSRRISKTTSTKKTATIQGQQSLLSMFGFQKKNSLKH